MLEDEDVVKDPDLITRLKKNLLEGNLNFYKLRLFKKPTESNVWDSNIWTKTVGGIERQLSEKWNLTTYRIREMEGFRKGTMLYVRGNRVTRKEMTDVKKYIDSQEINLHIQCPDGVFRKYTRSCYLRLRELILDDTLFTKVISDHLIKAGIEWDVIIKRTMGIRTLEEYTLQLKTTEFVSKEKFIELVKRLLCVK